MAKQSTKISPGANNCQVKNSFRADKETCIAN